MSTIPHPDQPPRVQPVLRSAAYFDAFSEGEADAEPAEPASPRDEWTADHTLSQLYYGYFEPTCLADKDPQTRRAYRESIEHWADIQTKADDGTPQPEPKLKEVKPLLLARFVAGLAQLPGKRIGTKMAKATIAKHVRHLQPVLDCAGPESKDNRAGIGALSKTPYFQRVKIPKQPPRPEFSLVELGWLLDACSAARRPRVHGLLPRVWWQALIIVIYNTGLRIGSALELRYEWIRLDGANGGWAAIAPDAIKREHGRDVPLNSYVLEALSLIRTSRELVFPWDCGRRHLDEVFQAIKRAAGLVPDDGRMFHAIRRLTSSQLAKQGPGVAQFVLGHQGLSTTQAHYINGQTAVHFTEQLTQPARNTRIVDRQQRLFE